MPILPSFSLTVFGYALLLGLRYALFAGLAWWLVWIWRRGRARWQHRRLARRSPVGAQLRQQVRREVGYSFLTVLVFGVVGAAVVEAKKHGYTLLYTDVATYGWPYLLVSTAAAIVFHDAWFYWTHRLMHHLQLYHRVHRIHHLSVDPTPWAAFAFHPLEAVVEAGIFPVLAFTLPLHPLAILGFLTWMMFFNVLGHLGHELYPRGFMRTFWARLGNTTTHHHQHHQLVKANFGLYFSWWDRWMGTNHATYEQRFEEVTADPPPPQPTPPQPVH